jgi:hypothetical protein
LVLFSPCFCRLPISGPPFFRISNGTMCTNELWYMDIHSHEPREIQAVFGASMIWLVEAPGRSLGGSGPRRPIRSCRLYSAPELTRGPP